ncbi:hypothetical protein TraAM80_10538 [Trypanosoma rangeli]|uniref:Uncharacterized protein n=1 Tax=Trypanosoma rangeli TaxID=5698 RepID=A0A422MNS6_TRYRA|nr:uncharacterized protein TraAM80_10538 [Trypanosoma rangeli]RNE94861.1 hypothetical protein TraAM80_10538 [Trypanosoma rangeli]|eukprot:RNE94861.1 hypothetical protein TraAM80_10538 [Trypanosoma rangeli]
MVTPRRQLCGAVPVQGLLLGWRGREPGCFLATTAYAPTTLFCFLARSERGATCPHGVALSGREERAGGAPRASGFWQRRRPTPPARGSKSPKATASGDCPPGLPPWRPPICSA